VKTKALSKNTVRPLGNNEAAFTLARNDLKFAALLALIAFLLYANTIGHSYVLDDAGVITNNEFVQQGFKGLGKIFTSEVWHFENVKLGYYRPLALATFAIENQFFPGNAMVSHFGNVLLYALTGFFLYLLLLRVFKNLHPRFSFIVTLLFVAHPIHTEVVANIKSRDEILSFLNLIIAGYALLFAYKNAKTDLKWMVVSCLFFYLALLSKESAMAGLILFPALLYFTSRFSLLDICKRTAPFLILIFLFQLHKYLAIGNMMGMQGKDIINYPYALSGSQTASMFMIFAWCLKLIFVPYPLCYSYAYNQIPAAEWTSPVALFGLLIALLIVFLIAKNIRGKSPFVFGLLVFAITLIPAMAFVLLRGGILAERFLYAPVLGFSIVITWLLWQITKVSLTNGEMQFASFSKAGKLSGIILLLFCLYSFQTIVRNEDWRNDFSLTSHDAQIAENNCQVQLHYGIKLIDNAIREQDAVRKKQFLDEGVAHLNTAIQIYPGLSEAYYQKGQAYYKVAGNTDSAIVLYNRAIMENSRYPFSYFGLAEIYENTGKQALASYYFNKAVEANPNFTQMVQLRERHRKKTGLDVKEFPSATDSAETDLDKKDFAFYMQMGMAYGQKGDFANAIRSLQKAVEMNPNSEEALINLSVCFGMTKNYTGGIEALQRALAINPNNLTALTNIAILYNHIGDKKRGEEYERRLEALKQR
jgi:tetratricopeptide (TPR) repeat protein